MGEGSEGGQTDGVGWYVGGWESARWGKGVKGDRLMGWGGM